MPGVLGKQIPWVYKICEDRRATSLTFCYVYFLRLLNNNQARRCLLQRQHDAGSHYFAIFHRMTSCDVQPYLASTALSMSMKCVDAHLCVC